MSFRYVHVESIFLCRLKTTCSFSKPFYSLLTITNIIYLLDLYSALEPPEILHGCFSHSFLPTFRTFAERETILSEQNGKVNVFKKNNIKKNLKKLKLKFEVTN